MESCKIATLEEELRVVADTATLKRRSRLGPEA